MVRPASAQETEVAEKQTSQAARDQAPHQKAFAQNGAPREKKQERRGAVVIAPLPISSPPLGSGIVPVFAYIFGTDHSSPASVLGAAGLATDNGSRALAFGGELYINQNTYRTTAIYLRGNLNYDLYGLGSGDSQPRLPLKQEGQAVFGELLRRTVWKFFVGPRFIWGSSLITVRNDNAGSAPLPPDIGLHTTLTALGFRVNRDSRPNRFYPAGGMLIDFTSDFFSQGLGSKYSFQSYKFTFNKYVGFGEKQVLAYNFFACGTGGQPPFYGNCIYGTNNQLRGYVAGRYLSRYMVGTQLEYRLSLPMRFGIVAFGGVGEVVPGGNQNFRRKNFLPSGGAGGRFQLSKKYHLNLRVDYAQGKDTHTWSIGVGEAF
jgi:outer membrane protein assembly factor BamA